MQRAGQSTGKGNQAGGMATIRDIRAESEEGRMLSSRLETCYFAAQAIIQ